jgi:serine/threonine-protein kinase HipA
MTLAEVSLWGRVIGAVSWDSARQVADFEYDAAFASSGIEVAPLTMPLARRIYSFPALPKPTFRGLPGLLADSLPDDFGNALINNWLARQGRAAESFNPVERLCYTGNRGMGALEYAPTLGPAEHVSAQIDFDALTAIAADILRTRDNLQGSFLAPGQESPLTDILRVGTSAGGARAKAIIAWNPHTQEVRSGQVNAGKGFSYWLLKFDGIKGNRDKELDDPEGYGLIEYGYYLMARAAGITMAESRLLRENGRSHFMTKRFDRLDSGGKLHMQTLGAIAHFDFRKPGAYSYEQALQVVRQLRLPMESLEEFFRRMVFNILARNQDDHVKNTAFLMQPSGRWSLAPAYDVTYSYNPAGAWTGTHQMSLNGKRDNFEFEDLEACAASCSMKKGRAAAILREVLAAVERWREFAAVAGVPENVAAKIEAVHRRL